MKTFWEACLTLCFVSRTLLDDLPEKLLTWSKTPVASSKGEQTKFPFCAISIHIYECIYGKIPNTHQLRIINNKDNVLETLQ